MSKTDSKELSFEQALQKLEKTVAAIEQGQVSLEDSIKRHEEGMALIRHCRERLAEAERRIQKLQLAEDGTLTPEPFDASASDEPAPEAT